MNRENNLPRITAVWPCCQGTEFVHTTRDFGEVQAMHRSYHNAQWRKRRRPFPIGSVEEWGEQEPERPPRCYHEHCTTEARYHLHDYGPRDGDKPQYVGVWGWCAQHKHESFEERRKQARTS